PFFKKIRKYKFRGQPQFIELWYFYAMDKNILKQIFIYKHNSAPDNFKSMKVQTLIVDESSKTANQKGRNLNYLRFLPFTGY
ncbi:hypothetical protein V7111_00895, partial [Neobacillus niacini]|uniref:hypothetical protein n=1 Tax=Neobacillus niacini TaxID=86668 RepID=UPI002FFFC667